MTREEAINEIKSWAIPSKKGREVLETLIPELAESEDERIRKEIIKFLRSPFVTENITDEKIDPWIAYLEKQKEQKPAEWSEEDENNLELVIDCIYKFYPDPVMKYKLKDWLKSIRPQPQMLEDWTSEDDELLADVLGCITLVQTYKACGDLKEFKMKYTGEELRSFVRSLKSRPRKQPHWKPSEQEKGALRTAIHILTEERNFPKAAAQLQNILNAFEGEDSRKDWKPSEEQMKALYCALNDAISLYSDKVSPLYEEISRTHFDALESLYNDLKKLM